MGFSRYAGVYKVASELRKNGYSCLVIDCFIDFSIPELEKIFEKTISSETLFIGFSSTFLFSRFKSDRSFMPRKFALFEKGYHLFPLGRPLDEIKAVLSLAKKYNPKLKTIVGGSSVSRDKDTYSAYGFDYFFEKEADVSIVQFAKHLENNRDDLIVISETKAGKVIRSQDYPYNGFSHSSIVWDESDLIEQGEALPIEIARGCVFRCKFCDYNMNGKKLNEYIRSEDSLYNELLINYQKFKTTRYLFTDDLINDSLDKLRMLERVLERLPFKIEWSSYARLDLIWRYPEMIPLLSDLGAKYLLFGIETLHDKAGVSVGKGLGKKKTLDTLESCYSKWGQNVYMASGFIIGLPHETIQSAQETYKWLTSPDCPLTKATFTAYILSSSFTDQSEISKDHARFGYRLYEKNGRNYWQNEQMTQEDAQQMMVDYNNTDSSIFSYMESGFYHRFYNMKSKLDFLGTRQSIVDQAHSIRRLQYKERLMKYLSIATEKPTQIRTS